MTALPGDEFLPALQVNGLSVEFPIERAVVRAVAGASFSVMRGETVALVGESGSGKSVSALATMGLVDPPGRVSDGEVRIGGQPVLRLREEQWRTLRGREVAVRRVPGHVALQEQHLVAAPHQLAHQAAVGGGVAVAPGGGDRQAENDDLQAHAASTGVVRQPCSTASNCAALKFTTCRKVRWPTRPLGSGALERSSTAGLLMPPPAST